MSAIFGPAGNAESFPYKSSADAPRWLAELGLDCYEYQCGKGVNVREETARNIGAAAVAASYAEPEMVYQDLEEARALMRKLGCIVIRTDNKAVEETAQEILRYYELAHPFQKTIFE